MPKPDYTSMSDRELLIRLDERFDNIIEHKCTPAAKDRREIFGRLRILEIAVAILLFAAFGISAVKFLF